MKPDQTKQMQTLLKQIQEHLENKKSNGPGLDVTENVILRNIKEVLK